jgi:hypothetical protein
MVVLFGFQPIFHADGGTSPGARGHTLGFSTARLEGVFPTLICARNSCTRARRLFLCARIRLKRAVSPHILDIIGSNLYLSGFLWGSRESLTSCAGRLTDDSGRTRRNAGYPCSGMAVDSCYPCGRIPGTYRAAGCAPPDNTGIAAFRSCKSHSILNLW